MSNFAPPTGASLMLHASPLPKIFLSAYGLSAVDCPPISSSTEMRQMGGRFVDTNVLLYLASGDARKADLAEAVVAQGGIISVQILNEVANVMRRKMQMSWSDTRLFLDMIQALLTVEPVTAATHAKGLAVSERYGLSVYDAMVVAAALIADCEILVSEDMHDGLIIDDRLRIVNPFGQS